MSKLRKSIFITFLLLVVCTITVYAAFTYSTRYSTNISVGKVENATLTSPTSNLNITFNNPGDYVEYSYSITNNDSKSYVYYYDLVLVNSAGNEISSNPDLLNMIYVYRDDIYVGLLKDVIESDDEPLEELFLLPNKTRSNKFKFELHNGATGLGLDSLSLYVRVDCYLMTTNVQKYLFVSSSDEFVKSVTDVNKSKDKTIVLTNNISVNTALSISRDSTIDLCGNTLTLNSDISVKGSVLNIVDHLGNGSVNGSRNFVLNDSTAFIDLKTNITNISISNYNTSLLMSKIKERVETFRYLDATITNDLVGYYSPYLGKLNFNISSPEIIINNGVTSVSDITVNNVLPIDIVIGNLDETIDLKVIGNSDIEVILTKYLAHLSEFSEGNSIQVTYDFFLPTKIDVMNATISWRSSDETIMNSLGQLQEEAGNITLTATIKVHDQVFVVDYFVYAVQQDNLSKLQYLATQVETGVKDETGNVIFESLLFNEVGQSFPLPTTVEGEHYYTKWTDDKKLGITELNYELESTYLYLGLSKDTNSYASGELIPGQILSTADISLEKVTYSKAARIKIIGKFDNGEIVETYIAINIDLPIDSLQAKVFKDVQNILNSVNVLENILKTREEFGVIGETGDFVLPSEIDSIELYFTAAENQNIYTISTDANGVMTIHIDLEQLELTDISVTIKCAIVTYDEEGNIVYLPREKEELTFIVPAALTPKNFKSIDLSTGAVSYPFDFNNKNAKAIFYSLKLQALQSKASTKYDATNNINNIKDSSVIYKLPEYILMYDIENTDILKFEHGDVETVIDYYDLTVYQTLIEWATGGTITVVPASIQPFLEQGLLWIQSDGSEDLSDEEITLILSYCERFPGFNEYWNDGINVLDNILSESEEAELLAELISDKNFIKLLDWITSTTTKTLYEAFGDELSKQDLADELEIPLSFVDFINDGKTNIDSRDNLEDNYEERVILYYVQANYLEEHPDVYSAFYNAWLKYVERNSRDSKNIVDLQGTYTFNHSLKSGSTSNTYNIKDPVLVAILDWLTYSSEKESEGDGVSLESSVLSSESIVKTIDFSLFLNNYLSIENGWGYAEGLWGVTKAYGNQLTVQEWDVLVEYLNKCGITQVSNYQLIKSDGSSLPSITPTSPFTSNNISATLGDTVNGYVLSTTFLQALTDTVNNLYSTHATNYANILSWAKSTTYDGPTSFTSVVSSSSLSNVDQYRIANNNANVSMDEYIVLEAYLSDVVFASYDANLSAEMVKFYLPLDMSFTKNNINSSAKNEILYTIDSQGEFKLLLDKIRYQCINGVPTISDDSDNLSTISAKELEALANAFADKGDFISKLMAAFTAYTIREENGVYVVDVVTSTTNSEFDRSLLNDTFTLEDGTVLSEKEYLEYGIKEILGSNTEVTAGLKYTFIPLDTIDEGEIKAFYAIRYFTNLTDVSFMGTSTKFLFDSTNTADQVFEVVANVATNLVKITFNYTGLSDISLITSMKELEYIDLRFNYSVDEYKGISDINPILTLQQNKVAGVNNDITQLFVYKTDLNFLYGEVVFAKLYSINNEAKLYYELEGLEVLYEPGSLNADQQKAINACAVLREIGTMQNPYILLPTKVYLDTTGNDVVWKLEVSNDLVRLNGNRLSVIIEGSTGEFVVSATVSVNGHSFTRYFYVTII